VKVVIIVLGALLVCVLIRTGVDTIGNWLYVDDQIPPNPDVIFTFAGEKVRENYSAEVINSYDCKYWVVSRPSSVSGNTEIFQSLLSDQVKIVTVDTCADTYSEMSFFLKWADENCLPRGTVVCMVSGPYQLRRISML